MTDHDPLCRQQHWEGGDCFDCRLIAKVRADERADLRAKVEALPVVLGLSSLDASLTRDASLTDAVRLRDVLALLPPDPRPGPLPPLAAKPPAAPGIAGAGRDEPTGDAR